MLSLRAHAVIAGGAFGAMIVLSVVGSALHDQGMIADGTGMQMAARIVFLGLCLVFVFALIPLMVKLVLGFQVRAGNAGQPVVRGLIARERTIVFVLWALIAVGLAIAIPAAIRDGAFDQSGEASASSR